MKKIGFILLLGTILFPNCTKDKDTGKLSLVLINSDTFVPGEFGILKANKYLDRETLSSNVGGKQVLLVKADSLHYVFQMPLLPPGEYKLSLREAGADHSPAVSVPHYTALANPLAEINGFASYCRQEVAELKRLDYESVVTEDEIAWINEVLSLLEENVAALEGDDLLLAGYQAAAMHRDLNYYAADRTRLNIRNSNAEAARARKKTHQVSWLTPDFTANTGDFDFSNERGAVLTEKTMLARATNFGADYGLKIMYAALTAAVLTKSVPAMAGALLAAGGSAYLKIKAKQLNTEIANLRGVATGFSDADAGSSADRPIIVSPLRAISQRFRGRFRTLINRDRGSYDESLSEWIDLNQSMEKTDFRIYEYIEKIKSVVGFFLGKIKTSYTRYESPIHPTEQPADLDFGSAYQHLAISNVSNSGITIQSAPDPAGGLSIKASNPSGNITSKTSFSFTMTYHQTALNNQVSVTKHAVYDPPEEKPEPEIPEPEIPDVTLLPGFWRIREAHFVINGTTLVQRIPGEFLQLRTDSRFSAVVIGDSDGTLEGSDGLWLVTGSNTLVLTGFTNEDIDEDRLDLQIISVNQNQLILSLSGRPGVVYSTVTLYLEK